MNNGPKRTRIFEREHQSFKEFGYLVKTLGKLCFASFAAATTTLPGYLKWYVEGLFFKIVN